MCQFAPVFHTAFTSARRSNTPLSHFTPWKKNPSREYYVRIPRLSARGINFSDESWGPLARPLAYQVARNSRVLADTTADSGGISSERDVGGAKLARLSVHHLAPLATGIYSLPPLQCPRISMISSKATLFARDSEVPKESGEAISRPSWIYLGEAFFCHAEHEIRGYLYSSI